MRLLRYTQCFGPAAGARIFAQTLAPTARVRLRIPGYPHPLVLRPGTSDVPTLGQIFVFGDYDVQYRDLAPRTILDAGANVGYSSVFLAQRFPEARILALEPDRSNFELLLENTQHYPNVTAQRKALWSKPTSLRIANPGDDPWGFRMEPGNAEDANAVEAMTVSDTIRQLGDNGIDLLKLDVEGAEREIFSEGYQAWIDRVQAFIVELHDRDLEGCAMRFYRAIAHLEYRHEVRGENTFVVRTSGPSD